MAADKAADRFPPLFESGIASIKIIRHVIEDHFFAGWRVDHLAWENKALGSANGVPTGSLHPRDTAWDIDTVKVLSEVRAAGTCYGEATTGEFCRQNANVAVQCSVRHSVLMQAPVWISPLDLFCPAFTIWVANAPENLKWG